MGDFESVTPELGGEENLVAAANQILRAIGSKKNLTSDEKKILAYLGTQLSSMNLICQDEVYELSDFERRLNDAEEKVLNWEADQSMIWNRGPDEACKYLDTADGVRKLTENLEILSLNSEDGAKDMLRRAHNVLQMVMARLEEAFKSILVQNGQPYEPGFLCFRSSEDEFAYVSSVVSGEDEFADVSSVVSGEDESMTGSLHRDSVNRTSEEFIIGPVHRDVIADLRRIANLMFKSKYDHECLQAYISVRRDALDECLLVLDMDKMSIEDVLKLEWSQMNSKMKRWAHAMKIFVRIYLDSEKWLAEQVFVEVGAVNLMCFAEASKSSMFQLLNFGEAIFIGPHKTEKMYPILEMYEVLEDLLPDIDSLYSDEAGCSVRMDCRDLLRRLGDAVRAAFLEFENAIASSPSTTPLASGGIHPLTKYVMNYIRTLTDYRETLNVLLKDHSRNDVIIASPDRSSGMEEDNNSEYASTITPMAVQFRSIVSILECNLEEKATLYRSPSLQHIFLMNNIHYIAQKVKNSELRLIFGDDWIRKRNRKVQQHALNYERVTWSSVLALLKDEGIPSSHHAARIPKERLRSFYLAFKEVYKNQKGWSIPDNQLRKELKISTSNVVVLAYRTFVGRHCRRVSTNHIKYSADDLDLSLEEMIEDNHVKYGAEDLDLSLEEKFEGLQKQLQHPNRNTTLGLQRTQRETMTSNRLNNSFGQDHQLTKVGLEVLECLVYHCGTTCELTL